MRFTNQLGAIWLAHLAKRLSIFGPGLLLLVNAQGIHGSKISAETTSGVPNSMPLNWAPTTDMSMLAQLGEPMNDER